MKIVIDENLKGKELYKFLVENKSALIKQKKSMIKKTDPVCCNPVLYSVEAKGEVITKAAITTEVPTDVNKLRVKAVGNTAFWFDAQQDVLLPDCWKRSIRERKGLIPHLHDHVHELDAELGDMVDIYSQEMLLSDLGINRPGSTQSLLFESDIYKSYNEKTFNKYKNGNIKQHSIGLQYVQIELAINDEESEKEFDFWNKYIDKIINKEEAEDMGFFWVVSEIRLIEISAVLFGANKLTQTLEVKTDTAIHPSVDNEDQPSTKSAFDIDTLINSFKNISYNEISN